MGAYVLDGPARAKRTRPRVRRMFVGELRNGVLTVGRGAEVVVCDRDGVEIERKRDVAARLSRNIGDWVVAIGPACGDAAALVVRFVEATGWSERWNIDVACGAVPDGRVHVIAGGKAKP